VRSRVASRLLPLLLVGAALGGLALVATLALHESSAVAAGTSTCSVSGTTATVTLDEAASPFTTTLSQDGSDNLLVNGTACGNFATGPDALTAIDLLETPGAPGQTVVLDQTGSGGLFPCSTAIDGTLQPSDTIQVLGAVAEDLAVGDSAPGIAGVDLDSCSSSQIGTITGVGAFVLAAGSGSGTLSAGGDAALSSPLDVPATLVPASGSSEILRGGTADDTIDFSNVATNASTALTVNVSGALVSGVANGTATVGSTTYTFADGLANFTDLIGASSGHTDFLASSTGGYTLSASGTGDSLDLAAIASGTTVDLLGGTTGTVCVGATPCSIADTDTISGLTTVTGSAGGGDTFIGGSATYTFTQAANGNTFEVGTGPETITDPGSTNTVDFSALSVPTTVNVSGVTVGSVANDTATAAGSTYSFGSSPTTFKGAASGSTTFLAGSSADTFEGAGSTNTLSFADSSGSSLLVCVVDASSCTGAGQAKLGATVEPFSGINDFDGLTPGNTDFVAGDTGGFSFVGNGTGNVADFSGATSGVDADLSAGTVQVASGTDTLSGIVTVAGSNAGANTFVAGASSETFSDIGTTGGDTIDFSNVATNSSTPLTVNVSGAPANTVANGTAAVGSTTYAFTDGFSNFTDFIGASSGYTDFLASATGGYSFSASDTGDSLDLSAIAPGATVDLSGGSGTTGTVCVGATPCSTADTDTISGLTSITGPAGGNTTFIGGTANYSFTDLGNDNTFIVGPLSETITDPGSGNTIDFGPLHVAMIIDAADDTATVGSSSYTFSSAPTTFEGSATGGTFFDAGSTADTFDGTGPGNVLSFAEAPTSSPLAVCVAEASPCTGANQAQLGTVVEPFSGISFFDGLATGNTTFYASDTGGLSFVGDGTGNVADFSAATSGVNANLFSNTVGVASGSDTLSGIDTVVGSSAGANTFVVGTDSETFSDDGSAGGDTIDFSNVATNSSTALTVNVSGVNVGSTVNGTATVGSTTYIFTDGFSNLTDFIGAASGNTTFLAGASPDSFEGSDTGNTLSFADSPGTSLLVCVVEASSCTGAGQAQIGSAVELFSGIDVFDGLAAGNTSFVAGSTGGYTFNGSGQGNSLDLSAAPPGATVTINGPGQGTVTGLTSGGPDSFVDIQSFKGASNIVSPVTAEPTSLAPTTVGLGYTVQLAGHGGTSPYSGWAVENGSLPPGLTLSASGLLSGTATAGGTFNFVVSLLDTDGVAGGTSYALTVNAAPNSPPPASPPPPTPPVTTSQQGYLSVAADGGIFNYGNAAFYGSMGGQHLNAPIEGMAEAPHGGGYWEVASDGGIFNFGNAQFYGSMGGQHLNAPIVGMAATPDGGGYWEVASDGGIFSFGDAHFYGSTGSIHLNAPIVGMAASPTGHGYWLVASDGGIFSYGDGGFFGSRGGQPLNKPIVGMAASSTGHGYWLVASDGGIFNYGDAGFFGSAGSVHLNKPIVSIMSSPGGQGYWLVASDGGIFNYGDAGFLGSAGSGPLNAPVVGGVPS
jgi:hypothetical protein